MINQTIAEYKRTQPKTSELDRSIGIQNRRSQMNCDRSVLGWEDIRLPTVSYAKEDGWIRIDYRPQMNLGLTAKVHFNGLIAIR
jgi:hypothetical protein